MYINCLGCFADCRFLDRCTALDERVSENCPFYKTEKRRTAEAKNSVKRLKELGRDDLLQMYRSEARYV